MHPNASQFNPIQPNSAQFNQFSPIPPYSHTHTPIHSKSFQFTQFQPKSPPIHLQFTNQNLPKFTPISPPNHLIHTQFTPNHPISPLIHSQFTFNSSQMKCKVFVPSILLKTKIVWTKERVTMSFNMTCLLTLHNSDRVEHTSFWNIDVYCNVISTDHLSHNPRPNADLRYHDNDCWETQIEVLTITYYCNLFSQTLGVVW